MVCSLSPERKTGIMVKTDCKKGSEQYYYIVKMFHKYTLLVPKVEPLAKNPAYTTPLSLSMFAGKII